MYFSQPSKDYSPTAVAPALTGTLYLGIFPARVLLLARSAAASLLLH